LYSLKWMVTLVVRTDWDSRALRKKCEPRCSQSASVLHARRQRAHRVLRGRPGVAEKVRHLLGEALRLDLPLLMSAINWSEVFYLAWKHHGESRAHQAETNVQQMPISIPTADRERATRAAVLKQKHGLGYADAFAAELAIDHGAWLVTSDPDFEKVGKGLKLHTLPRHGK
jgi:predicted nucleic acid-binding protein